MITTLNSWHSELGRQPSGNQYPLSIKMVKLILIAMRAIKTSITSNEKKSFQKRQEIAHNIIRQISLFLFLI